MIDDRKGDWKPRLLDFSGKLAEVILGDRFS